MRMCAQDSVLEIGSSPHPAAPSVANPYSVSGFEIKSRWAGFVSLPLKNGDLWTPEKQSEVFAAIREAFASEQSHSYRLNQSGEAGVLSVDVIEEKDNAAHTVKLIFRPLRVHVSFTKIGDNLLPIPRSASATRYEAVPAGLLALKPVFGVTYDRAFGTALAGGFQNDLLTLPDTLAGQFPKHEYPDHLDARFNGSKSFASFYRVNFGMAYSYRRIGVPLQELSFGALFDGAKEPLAGKTHTQNSGSAYGGATLRVAAHTRLTVNLGYRHVSDVLEDNAANVRTETEVQLNRLLAESLLPRPIGGFLRAAVWEDNGWTAHGVGSHQRLVGRVGFAREIAIASNQ